MSSLSTGIVIIAELSWKEITQLSEDATIRRVLQKCLLPLLHVVPKFTGSAV